MEKEDIESRIIQISESLEGSALIEHELTTLNQNVFLAEADKATVFFGTGLISGKKLTTGVPFDFMGYLLAAERARRTFGLGKIVHLIADNHAIHELPEKAEDIGQLAEKVMLACRNVAKKLGLDEVYSPLLASEMHKTNEYKQHFNDAAEVKNIGAPVQALQYLQTQMADMEYLRREENAVLKLSWVLDSKKLRGSGGFDEEFFDNSYRKVFGNHLSYVYTLSGRTFDPTKPRSSPYISTDSTTRLMLWPQDDVRAKMQPFAGKQGKNVGAALQHLAAIIQEYESLVGSLPEGGLEEKLSVLIQMGNDQIPFDFFEPKKDFIENARSISMKNTPSHTLDELIRGVAIQVPPDGIKEKLALAKKENRPLSVKLGFDPTAPDLHLGHAVVLRKMRQFQEAGHKLVVIIGDFTARIGDPTGRNKTRPPLSEEAIRENAQTYLEQLSKVLDMDKSKLEVRFNSEWLGKMNFADVLKLLGKATVAQILQREDFNNRYTNNVPIGMHEMLYPLMQGYDSLALNIDIEMGGTDQLFNCQMGRALQESDGKLAQIVVSMPLLVGLDGKEKMSKSHHNYIGLTEAPNDMYGKTMSMPDHLMANYLELATDLPLPEVNRLKGEIDAERIHPMDVKKIIAHNIVKQYHSEKDADAAAEFFYNQFQKKHDAEKSYKEIGIESIFGGEDSMNLVDLCAKLQPQMSKSQIRRLIASNAITIDGERASDPLVKVSVPGEEPLKLRIGKRGFFALTPKVG